MSTNYHTPYPAAMAYKTSLLNVPPGELDAQITINAADIAALEADINQAGLSAGAGKIVLVNAGGTALEFVDVIFHDDDFIVHDDDFIYH